MNQSFRSEVFKICKKLHNNETTEAIRNAILTIKVTKERNGEIQKNDYGDFIQLAEHSRNQFHGYLFADDYADKIQLPAFFSVGHLTSEERKMIEVGHMTLTRFVELCVDDISKKSKKVADAISPYYLYKSVSIRNNVKSVLEDEELNDVVKAFKDGKVYKALYESDIAQFFDFMDVDQMHNLMWITSKEFNTGFTDDVPSDMRTLSMKLMNNQMDVPDAMYSFTILLYALKESLRMACQLMFGAICGAGLIVLNNENIINIEKQYSSEICKLYKVFIQGCVFSIAGNLIGDVLLIDCDDRNNTHVKDFGMIISTTIQFAGEFGQTSKISFVAIDEEMIPITNITKMILRNGLPKMIIH